MAQEKKQFDQEFVEYVVGSIVDNPKEVTTERIVDEMGTLISLHVHADDMSTIIGKEGRTAKALRTILRVLGAKHNERINLKIIEPEGGRGFNPRDKEEAATDMDTAEATAATDDYDMSDALKDLPQDEIA